MSDTLLGVDTGGTFTDFVVLGDTGVRIHKALLTRYIRSGDLAGRGQYC